MITIIYLVSSMNTRGGGADKCKKSALLIGALISSDIALIFYNFRGVEFPPQIFPRLIGAELTYLITISYLLFSKKQRAYKAFDV